MESGRSISSWILRTFTSRTKVAMLTLWKSLAIPILEYCSVLWSPIKKGDIQHIESLQWSFIRKIKGTSGMNYWEALNYLNLFSLERRRERYQILYIWKILEKLVPNMSSSAITATFSPRHGRLCKLATINNKSSTKLQNIKTASLSVHGVKLFNCLPKCLRCMSAVSIDKFKKSLDVFLSSVPGES